MLEVVFPSLGAIPPLPPAAHQHGEPIGRASEANLSRKACPGDNRPEVSDGGVRCPQRRQAERDPGKERILPAWWHCHTPSGASSGPVPGRGAKASGYPGAGATALSDVLSALPVYWVPPRPELCALQWSDLTFRKDSLLLTISSSRSNVASKGIRGRLYQKWPQPGDLLPAICAGSSALPPPQKDGG